MRQVADQQLVSNLAELWKLVADENLAQLKKWGVQSCTPAEWMLYLTEEVGELAEAVAECEYRSGTVEQVVHEAIQVATLALKISEMYLPKEEPDVPRCEDDKVS